MIFPEAQKIKIEEVPRMEGTAESSLPRPAEVSRLALSSSHVFVRSSEGLKRVAYSVIPAQNDLFGREDDAAFKEKPLQIEVVQNFLRKIFRRGADHPAQLEAAMIYPEYGEVARPELVVKEQDRIDLGSADYAYMGDGQRMTVDGERPIVEEFVKNYPDNFPNAS